MKNFHNHFGHSVVGLILTAVFLLFVYPVFGWDELIINWYRSPDGSGFVLKNHFFWNGVLHDDVKKVAWLIPLNILILWLKSFKKESLIIQRRRLCWLFF